MSRFEQNPFDDDASNNPFTGGGGSSTRAPKASAPPSSTVTGSFFDAAVGAKDTSSRSTGSVFYSQDSQMPSNSMAPLPPESRSGSAFGAAADIPFSPKALKKKQKELQVKEEQLKRKERELASREETLGVVRPNWPFFFPLIRHDIRADIPDYLQTTQRFAFFSWMGCILALTYNFVAVMLAWIVGVVSSTEGIGNFFLALIFVLLGVPLSYFLWYRRLYNSLKNDSSFGLVLFFVSYLSHIGWFTFFSIAPPIFYGGKFVCGVMTTISVFGSGNSFIGIMYAIGTAFFISELVLSILVIGQVYAYFRGTGKANQLKQEAAMAALRNAV